MNELFPFEKVRLEQDVLMRDVEQAINNRACLVAHAPTGLGKTVATLVPAIHHAIKNKLSIFFLTSRHTQHKIAIDTIKLIRQKTRISATSIIGKKWMCIQPGVKELRTTEFSEYCRVLREEQKCGFYEKVREKNKPGLEAKKLVEELLELGTISVEELIELCTKRELCPYEIAALLASKSQLVIADYYYLFNPKIMTSFFNKTKKELSKTIIIIDEGHNLPARIRELMTQKISNITISRAINEALKNSFPETQQILAGIQEVLAELSENVEEEKRVSKKELFERINKIKDYDELVADLSFVADEVREKQRQSYIGAIASFLEAWQGPDEGFARILKKQPSLKRMIISLSYRCLDPSLATKQVIEQAYSTIIMSGTLMPTVMYKDILGFPDCTRTAEYQNPFPRKNRLAMIIPETTTRYKQRNQAQFKRIAEVCAELVNNIPGNTAIYFPSYYLKDQVNNYFMRLCKKTVFVETPNISKKEKEETLERFKGYHNQGAVLLAVVSGNFGEGIDLPGDFLKAVIVVGLPLEKPDLEATSLIEYYDKKFGKGWDYGYVFPAINRAIQSAGRCIRTETDQGATIFLDERYAWPQYLRCFPADWELKITKLYKKHLNEFFATK